MESIWPGVVGGLLILVLVRARARLGDRRWWAGVALWLALVPMSVLALWSVVYAVTHG